MKHVDQLQNFRLQSSKIHVKNTDYFFKKIIFDYAYIPVLTVHFVMSLSLKKSIYYLYTIISLTMIKKKKLQIFKEKIYSFSNSFFRIILQLMSFAETDSVRLFLDQLLQHIYMLMEIPKMKILLLFCKWILVIQTFVHLCLWKCC